MTGGPVKVVALAFAGAIKHPVLFFKVIAARQAKKIVEKIDKRLDEYLERT